MNVEVPAGVSTGTRLRLSGRGESGGRSGQAGDLFVEIDVLDDNRFERRDANLIHRTSIGIAEATLGTVVEVPSLDGEPAAVDVPPGTQPGTLFTLPGRGVPHLGRRHRGDLLIVVEVMIPESVTPDEEDLLRKWAELRGERTGNPASAP